MTFDDIAKICTDFYREDEIFAAKVSAEQLLPSPNVNDPTNAVLLWKIRLNVVLILM